MIKITGCCDGCGVPATPKSVKRFTRIPVVIKGMVAEFDLCDNCVSEMVSIKRDTVADQIHELQARHEMRG